MIPENPFSRMQSQTHRPILLVTRAWRGRGGMQRLSRDLCREAVAAYGDAVTCVHPESRGFAGLVMLCLRACIAAVRLRAMRPRIHLCDAALLPLGVLLRRIAGGRLSVTACGLDVVHDAPWYAWLMHRFLTRADGYVAISEATAEALVARGVPRGKISVIPCGFRPAESPAETDPRLLVTVGRLIPRKGVGWFLEHVYPRILQRVPDARYVIVGAGPEEARIRAIIDRLNLRDAVELKTDCTDDERDMLLSRAAVFVAPNVPVRGDMEGFGIVCIEAAGRGTPVAAARLEGLRDAVIEGETGAFFHPADADSCEGAVVALLMEPPSRAAVARAAAGQYGWDAVFPLYRTHVFDV